MTRLAGHQYQHTLIEMIFLTVADGITSWGRIGRLFKVAAFKLLVLRVDKVADFRLGSL